MPPPAPTPARPLGGRLLATLAALAAALVLVVGACAPDDGDSRRTGSDGSPPRRVAIEVRLPGCAEVVAALTPRARLAQRLMVGVDASDPAATAELVRATQVGGVFLAGDATRLLRDQAMRGVQAVARLPVAVAVDDEGGRVQRIDALDGELPSARGLAAQHTPEEVRQLGLQRGTALRARGVTVNLAPTLDLGGRPARDVIGDRAYSADPAVVARYAGAFAAGQRAAGILPVFKHFPGHGRADGDSHRGRVATPPLAELRAADLRPYAELLAGGPAGVMVGHLDVPGLTNGLPSSLTPETYTLLRTEYGFDGLALTDDLGAMRAVSARFALPEAARRALAAGADIALWTSGGPVDPVLAELERALTAGELNPTANDRAVVRVLRAKGACAP
jgi:beta-N-acetylhexosaminidase